MPKRRTLAGLGRRRTAAAALCAFAVQWTAGCDPLGAPGDGGDRRADAGTQDAAAPVDAATRLPDAGAPQADAGWSDAGTTDAGTTDAGTTDAGPPPLTAPGRVFFIGNSFTLGGPVPELVRRLAVSDGFAEPEIGYRAVQGRTLRWHREDSSAEAAPLRVDEGHDVVVLQEHSVGPTDARGDPARYKQDAAWFTARALDANAETRVVLFETWARRAGHPYYPDSFDDPGDMQAQLRFHIYDAAERAIPEALGLPSLRVEVSPVGDAWERSLSAGEPPRLHALDDYHANNEGQYLNALVLYSTIFGVRTAGASPLDVDPQVAAHLQDVADATTGAVGEPPRVQAPAPLTVGDGVRFDVGPREADGWPAVTRSGQRVGPVTSIGGAQTSVTIESEGFTSFQTGGAATNAFGWPPEVSQDSLWVGSFGGHDEAAALSARVTLRGLPPGVYEVRLFASRDGDDAGRGRLTRYEVAGVTRDLDASDNSDRAAVVSGVRPDARGELSVTVRVSPDGGARFGYLGAVVLTRLGGA